MTLLLSRSDLAPLFEDPASIRTSFEVITSALAGSANAPGEHTSWLAYPLGASQAAKVHVNLLAAPSGTSVRLFPPPTGPTVQSGDSVCLLMDEAGRLVAVMDLHDLGPWRTSGVAAVACRSLAPAGASVAATIGSGVEARYFVKALREALPDLKEVRVYSRTAEHRGRFAHEMSTPDLPVLSVGEARDAVEGADVIYINAASPEPLFQAEWVKPGALVSVIARMGVPNDLRARLVLPDLRLPELRSSGWDPWPVGAWERGGEPPLTWADVLRGAPARHSPEETLIYMQLGVFAWDAPLIRWAYEAAVKRGAGSKFQFAA
jgi:ornithine cyclodeaminase/alanine dehydrogenase-like protein (mu-crystallin family)